MSVLWFRIFHVLVSRFYTEIVIVNVPVGIWAAKATLRLGLQHPPQGAAPVAISHPLRKPCYQTLQKCL